MACRPAGATISGITPPGSFVRACARTLPGRTIAITSYSSEQPGSRVIGTDAGIQPGDSSAGPRDRLPAAPVRPAAARAPPGPTVRTVGTRRSTPRRPDVPQWQHADARPPPVVSAEDAYSACCCPSGLVIAGFVLFALVVSVRRLAGRGHRNAGHSSPRGSPGRHGIRCSGRRARRCAMTGSQSRRDSAEAGRLGAERVEALAWCEVTRSKVPDGVGSLPEHGTPRIDHHAAAKAGTPWLVVADLAGRCHVALVLDRPGPQQHLPVVPPGVQHEGGGHHQQLRPAGDGQVPVQLGEAQVVADRQADAYAVDVTTTGSAPGATVADSR